MLELKKIEKNKGKSLVINEMINLGVNHFIEVGPGKVLTGLVKRIDRNVRVNHVNNLENAKNLSND